MKNKMTTTSNLALSQAQLGEKGYTWDLMLLGKRKTK